jgi:PPOX class probable F420-dependent enzyme
MARISLPDAAVQLLGSAAVAHVVTLNADGSPHITVAWVGVDQGDIVMGTLADQRKLRNVRQDPRVAVSVQSSNVNQWGLLEYLVVYGEAHVAPGGAPELLQRLAHRYLGPDVVFPPMPNPPAGFVTRIAPHRLSGVGPWIDPGS